MTRETVQSHSRQVFTFHTSYFVLGLLQVLLGQVQVKIELDLLPLEFGKLGYELTGFLKSVNKIYQLTE